MVMLMYNRTDENPLLILPRGSSPMKEKTEPKGGPKPSHHCPVISIKQPVWRGGLSPARGSTVGVELPAHTSLLSESKPCLNSHRTSGESYRKPCIYTVFISYRNRFRSGLVFHQDNCSIRIQSLKEDVLSLSNTTVASPFWLMCAVCSPMSVFPMSVFVGNC